MELAIIISKYQLLYATSKSFSILGKFLSDDIGYRKIDSIIEWINNDKYKSVVLNVTYLVKYGEKINIYFFYDGYNREESAEREKFEISKNELIAVIKSWKTDHIEGPYSSLVITVENGKIKLDSRNSM